MSKFRASLLVILALSFNNLPTFAKGSGIFQKHATDPRETPIADEHSFESAIAEVYTIYRPLIQHNFAAQLVFESDWNNPKNEASADKRAEGMEWVVKLSGGFVRDAKLTKDEYTAVVCHEIGHFLSG